MGKKLYVGNLSFDVDNKTLEQLFADIPPDLFLKMTNDAHQLEFRILKELPDDHLPDEPRAPHDHLVRHALPPSSMHSSPETIGD